MAKKGAIGTGVVLLGLGALAVLALSASKSSAGGSKAPTPGSAPNPGFPLNPQITPPQGISPTNSDRYGTGLDSQGNPVVVVSHPDGTMTGPGGGSGNTPLDSTGAPIYGWTIPQGAYPY